MSKPISPSIKTGEADSPAPKAASKKGTSKVAHVNSHTFDPKAVNILNEYYRLRGKDLKMPFVTTPDNFDVRWLVALMHLNGSPVDPFESEAQFRYDQTNMMVFLTRNRTLREYLFGMTAKQVIDEAKVNVDACAVKDVNGSPLISEQHKPRINRLLDLVKSKLGANDKIADLFTRTDDEHIKNVIVPALAIKTYSRAICIPLLKPYLNGGSSAVGELTHLYDLTVFEAHFTSASQLLKKKGTTKAALTSLKAAKSGGKVVMGDDDDPNNKLKCINQVCTYTGDAVDHCVTNPTTGSCAVV